MVESLLTEAWRLEPFVPPFTFSAFFSPEDTLLCVCAAESARNILRGAHDGGADIRIAELTSGSGLVGLYLVREEGNGKGEAGGERREAGGSTLLGLDVDEEAAEIGKWNAQSLGLADRARFARSDLWSPDTLELLRLERPQLLVCNPPYVPEPPGTTVQLEAGAGPHGTAHLLRALELTRELRPETLALSWCSLSDPAAIVAAAEDAGYEMRDLFVTAIADGEYSGLVHSYLRDLDNCYINEQPETLEVMASDGAARFAYLLFAGSFGRREAGGERRQEVGSQTPPPNPSSPLSPLASRLSRLCERFAREGISALESELDLPKPPTLHRYILNRWDELQLRVMLHGVYAAPT